MNNGMQEQDEMQEKELYALLEQALTQERLCVSEELIQKTLKRIEEQGTVQRMPEHTRRNNVWMRYASVAAAAMLVVALGIGMRGGIGKNNASNEAMPEMAAERTEESVKSEYSTRRTTAEKKAGTSGNVVEADSETVTYSNGSEDLMDAQEPQETCIVYLEGTEVCIPGVWEKTEAEDTVVPETKKDAEYWEFVDTEADWQAELMERLAETEAEEYLPLGTGDYEYALACHDGSRRIIGFREPLERIVKIPTEQGVIWCLFGEELYLYRED